jgi:3,4-dihydroxy 2-butanone 4-phosphate synthase
MPFSPKLERALTALRNGDFILIYDAKGREEETDFIVAAEHVTPDHVYRMRHDGGGLVFMMLHHDIAAKLGLPFLAEVFAQAADRWPALARLAPDDIPYDTKSSFSLPVNHRETFTGITDTDRALTIREMARLAHDVADMSKEEAQQVFGERYRAPGHVAVCRAANGLLRERRGHTELSVALADMADVTPVMAGCEMMDHGTALSRRDAMDYADEHDLVFLEGEDIVEAWTQWSG